MSNIFIQNPTDSNVGVQIVGGDDFTLINNGPDGAVNTEGNRTGICLAPYVVNTAEAVSDGTVELEGTFVIQVGNKIIPHSFTPEQLPEFFDGLRPEALNVKFEKKINEIIIDDALFTKATYIQTDTSNAMWIGIVYLPENATGQLHIDWGDGNKEVIDVALHINDDYSFYPEHQYVTNGEYVVKVYSSSKAYSIMLGNITKVTDWGKPSSQLLQLESEYLIEVPTTLHPAMTDLSFMFHNATTFNQDISMWDTSNVTMMEGTFDVATAFNQDISNWNVSNVNSMARMFDGAIAFNQPIGSWDVSNVKNMGRMFGDAQRFNQPLDTWNVSNVTDMYSMFQQAFDFNQDLSQWCVPLIISKPVEFDLNTTNWTLPRPVWGTCPSLTSLTLKIAAPGGGYYLDFNSISRDPDTTVTVDWGDGSPIENWTENTQFTPYHEYATNTNCTATIAFNKPLGQLYLNGPAVTEIVDFGSGAIADAKFNFSKLVKVPTTLAKWVTMMRFMFGNCGMLNDPAISNWDTSSVTNMNGCFEACAKFNQPLNWDVNKVTNMEYMFNDCSDFNQDLSQWCVGLIPTLPAGFNANAFTWELPRPVWGTCPQNGNEFE